MPGYSTRSRFTLTQLYLEDRKQRAHLKKITEMQRFSSLDNGRPLRLPQLHQNFVKQLNDRRQVIGKENQVKSQKLLNIMSSRNTESLPSFRSIHQNRTTDSPRNNTEYFQRIAKAKAKGNYNVRDWNKQFEQHKEYLRISKDGQLFTPLNIGVNRQRLVKTNSVISSNGTTPTSSLVNIYHKYNRYG